MKQVTIFLCSMLLTFVLHAQTKPVTEAEPTLEEAKEFVLYVLNTAQSLFFYDSRDLEDIIGGVSPVSSKGKWSFDRATLTYSEEPDGIAKTDIVIDFLDYISITTESIKHERVCVVVGSEKTIAIKELIDLRLKPKVYRRSQFVLTIISREDDVEARFVKAITYYLKLVGAEPKKSKF